MSYTKCAECLGKGKIALFTSVVVCDKCNGLGKIETVDDTEKRVMEDWEYGAYRERDWDMEG